jgi:DNA-binding beta-propeller fold protein YncE
MIAIFIIIYLLIPLQNLNADNNERFNVIFVKSISSSKDILKNKSFFNKVKDFIVGDDDYSFSKPNNIIAIDTSEYLVLDQGNQGIVSINVTTSEFEFIENKVFQFFPSLAGFSSGNNYNYFTDSKLNKIFIIDKEKHISEFKTDIILNQPTGLSFSKISNQLVVSETANHRVVIFDENGEIIKIIGQRGVGDSEFNFPTYNCTDKDGNIYINDAMNFRIQIFDKEGTFKNQFGSQGDASGYFASSKGLAIDSYGHIYVVDALFNCVQIFDRKGDFLYSFGKKGSENGEFLMPAGIFIDKSDYIYVADAFNSRIQIFKLTAGS